MSSFAPSLEEEKSAGIRITRLEYPPGLGGVKLSLEQIAQRIREGALSPKVQGAAADALLKAGFNGRGSQAGSARQRAAALLSFVRATTLYAPDPPGTEYNKSAEAMLCLRPGLCVRVGDCFPEETLLLRDDHALVAIKDIREGDRIWGYDRWTTVKKQWYTGLKKIDTLVLNNGSQVPLSPDHHVFVGKCVMHPHRCSCGWENRTLVRTKLRDVSVGAVLPQPRAVPFGKGAPDPRRAYVEGLFLSEGWFDARRFAISGLDGSRKEALKHEVKAICDAFGVRWRWHRKYIAVNDKTWALELHELGGHATTKAARTLHLTEAAAAELLRGIMSDSTANTHGAGRTFSTTSDTLKTQLRVLQRMFSTSTSVRYLTPAQHKGFGANGLWRVGVRSNEATKREKILRVKALERDVGEARCYDITTDDGFVYLPEHDVTVSNCDDQIVLLGSMLMGVGIPVNVVKQTFGFGDQEHVLLEAVTESGLFPLDPSSDMPAGQKASASHEFKLDPSNPSMIGLQGVPEAEFIGVGGLPFQHGFGALPPRPVGVGSLDPSTWSAADIFVGVVTIGVVGGLAAGAWQRFHKRKKRKRAR